ncbi:hypothetical protein BT69DRAFT_1276115, partial [Atractiella rhizophila]
THENALCASSKGPGYKVILSLDGQYQDILSHLPSKLTNLQNHISLLFFIARN